MEVPLTERPTLFSELAPVTQGDLPRLFGLAYDDLLRHAHRQRLGWAGAHTVNTTALVHEAYEKLAGAADLSFQNRAHFLAVAARAMRQVLLDYAKGQHAQKRGGGRDRVSLGDAELAEVAPEVRVDHLLTLHDALERLSAFNPEGAHVVECRFYGGMTVEETAAALGVSEPTVKRRWRAARAWLHRELALVPLLPTDPGAA
jgi:RNA polymerase sigma factor (TIGR02999 family)